MKRALFTLGVGTHVELLKLVRANFQEYAKCHQLDFFDSPLGVTTKEQRDRAPSWWKIPGCLELFRQGYEEVHWLDCDCVIMQPRLTMLDELPQNKSFGIVVHQFRQAKWQKSPYQMYIPNAGNLVLRPASRPLLEAMWTADTTHRWWEQASLMKLLQMPQDGIPELPTAKVKATNPWWDFLQEIPFKYNAFPPDCRYHDSVTQHSRHIIRHAAGMKLPDRVKIMQQWLTEVQH